MYRRSTQRLLDVQTFHGTSTGCTDVPWNVSPAQPMDLIQSLSLRSRSPYSDDVFGTQTETEPAAQENSAQPSSFVVTDSSICLVMSV